MNIGQEYYLSVRCILHLDHWLQKSGNVTRREEWSSCNGSGYFSI